MLSRAIGSPQETTRNCGANECFVRETAGDRPSTDVNTSVPLCFRCLCPVCVCVYVNRSVAEYRDCSYQKRRRGGGCGELVSLCHNGTTSCKAVSIPKLMEISDLSFSSLCFFVSLLSFSHSFFFFFFFLIFTFYVIRLYL